MAVAMSIQCLHGCWTVSDVNSWKALHALMSNYACKTTCCVQLCFLFCPPHDFISHWPCVRSRGSCLPDVSDLPRLSLFLLDCCAFTVVGYAVKGFCIFWVRLLLIFPTLLCCRSQVCTGCLALKIDRMDYAVTLSGLICSVLSDKTAVCFCQ